MFNGKFHYKWSFSIAMLNYQRVSPSWPRRNTKIARFCVGLLWSRGIAANLGISSTSNPLPKMSHKYGKHSKLLLTVCGEICRGFKLEHLEEMIRNAIWGPLTGSPTQCEPAVLSKQKGSKSVRKRMAWQWAADITRAEPPTWDNSSLPPILVCWGCYLSIYPSSQIPKWGAKIIKNPWEDHGNCQLHSSLKILNWYELMSLLSPHLHAACGRTFF